MNKEKQKPEMSEMELQFIRDRQYRILKSMMYKFQLPIKSVAQNPKQDNFIAYSIVKKVSQSGWFANQRLLVIDCTNNELFYLSKVPPFILDESSPIQIEQLRESPFVKQRLSLNSFSKEIKNVQRQDKNLIIELSGAFSNGGEEKPLWKFEMTSTQMAKDWLNMITLLQKGKLKDPGQIKKMALTPEKHSEMRKNTNNLPSTPKSITSTNSLQMKSENPNANSQGKQKNLQGNKFSTPNNKATGSNTDGDDEKYFKKPFSADTKGQRKNLGNLGRLGDGQNSAISEFEKFDRQKGDPNDRFGKMDEREMKFLELADQFDPKENKNLEGLTDKDTRYTPLSQEKQTPQTTFINEEMRRQMQNQKNSINSKLYKKYKVNINEVIEEEGEEVEIKNVLTEEYNIRNSEGNGFEMKEQEENKEGQKKDSDLLVNINLNKRIRKNKIMPAHSSEKEINETFSPNKSPNKKSPSKHYSPNKMDKHLQMKSPFTKPISPYKNTYNPVKSVPELFDVYDWNEIYHEILIEYYDCLTSYDLKYNKLESKTPSNAKHSFIQQKAFDILLKLEKHIEKFQVYCSKATQLFVQTYILSQNYRNQTEPKSSDPILKILHEQVSRQEGIANFNQSQSVQDNLRFDDQSQSEKDIGGDKNTKHEKNSFQFRGVKKMIEFQYEGIYFFVVLNPIQQSQELKKDSKSLTKFCMRQKIIKKLHWDLTQINHLRPYFTQTDANSKSTNYFHVFTPMLCIMQYAGLNFYCKAIFHRSNSRKYTKVELDSEAIERSMKKHVNINRYIKQRLGETSLTSFIEENFVEKIETVFLSKEFGRHTYLVVDDLELDEDDLHTDELRGLEVEKLKLMRQGKGQKGKLAPMMDELERTYQKELFLLQTLQINFTHQGAISLTSHEAFTDFLLMVSPTEFIDKMTSLIRLYDLVKNQFKQRQQFLSYSASSYRFLKNPLFLSYLTKLLQNQIVTLSILSEIQIKSRRFLSRVYFKAQQMKVRVAIPSSNTLKPLYHNVINDIDSLELIFEQFSWANNKSSTVFSLHQNQSFESPELNEIVLNQIFSKAMNELFAIEKEQKRTESQIEGKIKLRPDPYKWIIEQTCTNLTKDEINALDMNYIYEALMHDLGIQRYFDPINFETDTLESMMKMAKANKEELEKLIRDPYFPKSNQPALNKILSRSYLSSMASVQLPRHHNQVEYVPKLMDQTNRNNALPFPIKACRSIKYTSPTAQNIETPKIKFDLTTIHELVLQKDFNQAIQIYYLLINSNKKSSSVYYEYFKQVRGNISRPKKDDSKSGLWTSHFQKEQQSNHLYHTPALMTYVLATQCVAFSFLKLLYGRNNKPDNARIQGKSVFKSSTALEKTQKNQYLSLTLKYNVMSHFGTQIIYGYEHVIYMVNQLIFGFVRLKNQEILQAGQHFEQAQRTMEDANDVFLYKEISLPVLYIKALMDLQCRYYRAALQSLRMLMQAVEAQWKRLRKDEDSRFIEKTYWIEEGLTEMFEAEIQDLNTTTMNLKLQSYTYLAYEILILCNQNDPRSKMALNREIIKSDIVDSLKDFSDFNDYTVKMFQLLWNVETKIMQPARRTLVRRALMKMYNNLIKQKNKQKQLKEYDLEQILNPFGKSKHPLTFLMAYALFHRILVKSEKYWNFLTFQFNVAEFKQFAVFLSQKATPKQQNPSKSSNLEHYDIKRQLFKEIILIMKLMLMLGENFIYQSLTNSKHEKRSKKNKDSDDED